MRRDFEDFTRDQNSKYAIPGYKQLVFRFADQHWVATPGCTMSFDVRNRQAVIGNQIDGSIQLDANERARTSQLRRLFDVNKYTNVEAPHLIRFLVETAELGRIIDRDYVVALRLGTHSGDTKIRYVSDDQPGLVLFDPNHSNNTETINLLRRDSTSLIDIRLERESTFVQVDT